jgi:hypothetical protein
MNRNHVLRTFRGALSDLKSWITASAGNWMKLRLPNTLNREDVCQLKVVMQQQDDDELFDHIVEQRALVLYPKLLDAYATYWSSNQISPALRKIMAELFLLHELKHISQQASSASYRLAPTTSNDFFVSLDYSADAFAIGSIYSRRSKPSVSLEKRLLHNVMYAHLHNGRVFGELESTTSIGVQSALDGARIRRQLRWAIQAARADGLPQEFGYDALRLSSNLDVQFGRLESGGLGCDLCSSQTVTSTDLCAPMFLNILIDDETGGKRLIHTLRTSREVDALRDVLFAGKFDSATRALRPLFAENPFLVCRGEHLQLVDGFSNPQSPKERVSDASILCYDWDPARAPASALLRADCEVVPFHFRSDEIREYTDWCERDEFLLVRVVTGPGGVGKTRFCRHFCKLLFNAGKWSGGFVTWSSSLGRAPFFGDEDVPTIAVIDYAELATERITAVLDALLARRSKSRVILLSRTAGLWLDKMQSGSGRAADILCSSSTEVLRMDGIGSTAKLRGRSVSYAQQAFKRKLGMLAADVDPTFVSSADNTLVLHATALMALLGATTTDGSMHVLEWLSKRERRFWMDHARLRGLSPMYDEALCEVAALICTRDGASDRDDAMSLVRCSPLLDKQPELIIRKIAELFRDLYPGPQWLNPVQPDLVKETIIGLYLSEGARAQLAVL